MTGLWQISGRSSLGFDDLVRLDFFYIENWSLWLDISILAKTIPAVLTRTVCLLAPRLGTRRRFDFDPLAERRAGAEAEQLVRAGVSSLRLG